MRIVTVTRKPCVEDSTTANVLVHEAGALNIEACRVHGGPSAGGARSGANAFGQDSGWNKTNVYVKRIDRSMARGRWPANVIFASGVGDESETSKFFKRVKP